MVFPPTPETLSQLDRLLDAGAVRDVLERSLDQNLGDVRVQRVSYKPGERVDVHYETGAGDAVASAVAGVDLAALARSWAPLAGRIEACAHSRAPVSYDGELDAVIAWLPFDPYLGALAEPAAELAARLGVPPAEPRLLRYKPHARATVRLDEHVLKAYGRDTHYERALGGLVARLPVSTAAYEGSVPDLRLTMQHAVAGTVPSDACAAAEEAGEAVARLQHAEVGAFAPLSPADLLHAAVRKAALIAAVAPELRDVVQRLGHRLADTLPDEVALVTAHGDFHVDQLLHTHAGITILDFDDLCLASPALDLATYAADVVRGRAADERVVATVLTSLLEGYGRRPAGLEWHLATVILARAAHPFQRQTVAWRQRTAAMVAMAERVLG
jgi:hypothetical protein